MASVNLTPEQDTVVGEIQISAPPARVFQAITDPQQLPKWWGQEGLYRTTNMQADLRVGGRWRSEGVGADGRAFHVQGQYLEIDPPRLLVYTWEGSFIQTPNSVVRWELKPSGDGTLVQLRHSGLPLEAAKMYAGGWPSVLSWMQAFVEKGEVVDTRKPASAA